MNYLATRKEAQESGAKYYFTGKPCRRGHIAIRKTKGDCLECVKIVGRESAEKRKGLPKSEAAKEAGRRYYERNRAQVMARAAARPLADKQRYKKKHKLGNLEYYKTLTNTRRRRFRDATPKWLSYIQKQSIKALYMQAMTLTKLTSERYVVDHIVPLHGETVCGLHVPWNLRVITQEENLVKSNKIVDN